MKEFKHLPTSELDDQLREELEKEIPDRETVLAVLNELENRDPTNSENRPDGVLQTYEECVSNYPGVRELPEPNGSKKGSPKWIGALVAAAAIVIVLSLVVPQAVGAQNIFEIIGKWTDNLFAFSNTNEPDEPTQPPIEETPTVPEENEGLRQLYDTVKKQGVTEAVVPTWIPEGYELQEIKFYDKAKIPKIYARFVKGEQYIQMSIEIHSLETTNEYTKDDTNVILYESDGVFYYVVPNENTYKAIWTTGKVECVICTNDTEDVLYDILNSIKGRVK